MPYLKSVVFFLFFLFDSFNLLPSQDITFYPEADTIKVIDGCTGSEIICTLSSSSYLDSIIISPGFNTHLEYVDSLGQTQYPEKCYYLVTDTLNEFDYEIWYYPRGVLPYFQQLYFDSTFVTWDEYFELKLIVKSQRIHLDSLNQFFKSEGGLGLAENRPENISDGILLYPNYPNPFNNRTNISFFLKKKSQVNLSVYNIIGQKIATILAADQLAGYHSITWDATDLNSSIYYLYLSSEDYLKVQKCLLLK
jgi:hypothetical protein